MSGAMQNLRNQFAVFAATAAEKEIDGREITKKLDAQLDAQLGENASEKVQRGPLTNLLLEMVEGLHDEDQTDLIKRLDEWRVALIEKSKGKTR